MLRTYQEQQKEIREARRRDHMLNDYVATAVNRMRKRRNTGGRSR